MNYALFVFPSYSRYGLKHTTQIRLYEYENFTTLVYPRSVPDNVYGRRDIPLYHGRNDGTLCIKSRVF